MAPVQLPGHLDQEALLLPQGAAGLQPLGGTRWAEPLRDAVPRLLRDDLARWLGAPLWAAPLPPGLLPTVQLRLAFSAFDVAADGQGVDLRASWSLADPAGASAPRVFEATIKQPALALTGQNQAQALASAHRQALARLAQHIAESAR